MKVDRLLGATKAQGQVGAVRIQGYECPGW